jgi:hypothetical protein
VGRESRDSTSFHAEYLHITSISCTVRSSESRSMVSSTGGEASFPSHALTLDTTIPLAADPVKALVLSLYCDDVCGVYIYIGYGL